MDADCPNSISTRLRIVREYDFFEQKKTRPWRIFPSSAPKEVVFPQIIQPDQKIWRNSGGDSLEFDKNPTTTIRLFGVNITIDHHGDRDANYSSTTSREIQDIITIDEKTTAEENPSRKRKSRNPNFIVQEAPAPVPPPFHPRILQGLIEQHPILLIEKKLEFSDVSRGQNRLLITKSDQLMAALTEEEREKVGIDFVRVVTTDNTHGVEYTLHLKMWAASRAIVLKHQWSNLVAANGLQKGDSVQGWGYRVQDHEFRLGLVIVKKSN